MFKFLFQSLLLIGLFTACDECYRVECANGGECRYGECVCEDGEARPFCKMDTCFSETPCLNGHCEYGLCVCDENWDGEFCDNPTYVNHEGDYFGAYVCEGYQWTRTIEFRTTDDKWVYEVTEPDSMYEYLATFSTLYDFTIDRQTIDIRNNMGVDISGWGNIRDGEITMSLLYYRESSFLAEECTFEGELNPIQ